jgi:hypothetical protein
MNHGQPIDCQLFSHYEDAECLLLEGEALGVEEDRIILGF